MRWQFVLIGVSILATGTGIAAEWEQPYPILGSCTKKDSMAFSATTDPLYTQCMGSIGDESFCSSLYPPIPLPFAEWAPQYHRNIERVLEDFLGKTVDDHLALRRSRDGPAMCSLERADPASPVIDRIAKSLEPWAEGETVFRQADTTPVLLEYLRVYECSLVERSMSLAVEIWRDEADRRGLLPGGLDANPFFFISFWEIWEKQFHDIQRELAIARPTLERVLAFMGTVHMTRIFDDDVECIQRASLDLRNAFALSADVAACMPRIWNAKDPLRDLPACSDGRDNDNDRQTDLGDSGCDALSDMSE